MFGDDDSSLVPRLAKQTALFFGEQLGELVKDEVHFIRWKYAHWVFDRAARHIKKRKVRQVRCLPPGLAIRFLDAVSLEDEADIKELWARLLANAADPGSGYTLSKTHIAILSEMNALDARVLRYFRGQGWLQFRDVATMTNKGALDCKKIASDLNVPGGDVGLALGNLWRLGCLLQEPTYESGVGPSVAENSSFRPSELGRSLLDAVSLPDED